MSAEKADTKRAGRTLRESLQFGLDGLNQLLWPCVCINCKESIRRTDEQLCKDCWAQLLASTSGDYCRRCGRDAGRYAILEECCPDCQGREIAFDGIGRCGVYDGSLREMIVSFKHGRTELRRLLSFLLASALQGSGFANEIEMIVPVPLHWSRRVVRGFNQSLVVARQLKQKVGLDLVRVRRTAQQITMATDAERAANVAGAFAVRRGHDFAGRRICLVDDIKTTGATLNECARTLKQAGAVDVYGLVLAVAGQNR